VPIFANFQLRPQEMSERSTASRLAHMSSGRRSSRTGKELAASIKVEPACYPEARHTLTEDAQLCSRKTRAHEQVPSHSSRARRTSSANQTKQALTVRLLTVPSPEGSTKSLDIASFEAYWKGPS